MRPTVSSKKLDILVLCDFHGADANVIRDYLYSFNAHSRHNYYYCHNWRFNRFQRTRFIDFNRFDVIILFWDYLWLGCANPKSPLFVPEHIIERIAKSPALKVQFLQDEYRDVRAVNEQATAVVGAKRQGVTIETTIVK